MGEEDYGDVPYESFRVLDDSNEHVEETEQITKQLERIIGYTKSTVHGFHIQSGTSRYGVTLGCAGSKHSICRLSYAYGVRILRLMSEDPEDKTRVGNWDNNHD